MKIVVYTDLDATLLDADTYSWEPARPALDALRAREAAIVLVSSKTFSEMLPLHRELGLRDPFVIENGGGIVTQSVSYAAAYFQEQGLALDAVKKGDVILIPLGERYGMLTRALSEIGAETGCEVRGFSAMSVDEVARLTGLAFEDAQNAKDRDFDEPFVLGDSETGCVAALRDAARRRGLTVVSGGRFQHLIGHEGKGRAVLLLRAAYRELFGEIRTIGLGDSPNDFPFLELVDIPVLVGASTDRPSVPQSLTNVRLFRLPGPYGWNAAVLEALAEIDHS